MISVFSLRNGSKYAEDGTALDEDDTQSFYEKYISRRVFPAFYIRNQVQETDQERNQRRRQEQPLVQVEEEYIPSCVICLDETVSRLRLTCNHEMCRTCFNTCLSYGQNNCPICRRSTVFRDLVATQ